MPSAPDYSQYIAVKKINVAQTANTTTTIIKRKAPNRFDGYFPLYNSIRLPPNALLSNKFTNTPAAPAGPPPFAPSDIANLTLWLDGADATTLTLSGSDVVTWTDKSIIGNNYTQASSGSRPVYQLDPVFGFNGLLFDGVSDNLQPVDNTKRSVNSSIWNVFFVSRFTGNVDNFMTVYRGFLTGFWARFRDDTIKWSFYNLNTDVEYVQERNNARGVFSEVNYTTEHTVYQNGSQIGTAVPIPPVNVQSDWIALGGNGSNANENMTGYIFEFIIYNGSVLTTLERQKVEGYLAWKWGLQSTLPADHPYKAAKP
jgi:hypothetical protein